MKSSMTDQLLREAVARIISPKIWALIDEVVRIQLLPQGSQQVTQKIIDDAFTAKTGRNESLTKADVIIALLKGSAVSQSGSAEDAPSGSERSDLKGKTCRCRYSAHVEDGRCDHCGLKVSAALQRADRKRARRAART